MSTADRDRALLVFLNGQDPETLGRLRDLVNARTSKTPPPPTDGPATYRGITVPRSLHHNWDQHEASWWRAGVDAALDVAVPLVDLLHSEEPCQTDHHGYCQVHGLPIGGSCPDGEALKFIKEARGD